MSVNKLTFNLMIAGIGGQGTVLASKLIAIAAMKKGYDVRTTETIGMAQRGGSVFGHVRIGENIFSPIIPLGKADAIIAFEPAEAVRQLPYLRKDGTVIVYDNASANANAMADYLRANVSKLVIIDGKRLMLQSARTLNAAILGAAAQIGIFPFDAETLKETITEALPQRFLELNLSSFESGRSVFQNN